MKVLVTGGAGYIGSVVVQQLVDAGHKVVVLDDLSQGHRKAVSSHIRCEYGDISLAGVVTEIMRGQDFNAVIHLAALVAVEDSLKHPGRYYRVNVTGTLNVLEAMAFNHVKRLVFASSAAVYGDLPNEPVKEKHPLRPFNVYGQTKAWGEQMIEAYCQAYGINATCLRFFNVAGATKEHGEDHQPEPHLFPNVIKAAMNERPVPIYGFDYPTKDGTPVRDFIDVRDIAQAHIMALDKLEGFQVFNLGNGRGFTCMEVVNAISRARADVNYVAFERQPRRPGDIAGMVANASKARDVLGWVPRYTLDDMASSAYAWAQVHPRGYDAG